MSQQQDHPLTTNNSCSSPPKHQSNLTRKPQSDTLKFKARINRSTHDTIEEYNSALYLFSDGTFDYSIDMYSANDEMGGSYYNQIHGVWQLQSSSSSLVMVPHYQKNPAMICSEEWQQFQKTARSNLMIVNDNFNGENLLGWSPEYGYTSMDLENAKLYTVTMTKFE